MPNIGDPNIPGGEAVMNHFGIELRETRVVLTSGSQLNYI